MLDTIYVDGTFQVRPSLFTQLFTINGFLHGQQSPLVYALLPSKSRNDYNRLFTLLREKMQTLGLRLEPEHVMADFEISLVQSIRASVSSSINQGLLFPFSQCLWKKVQALGLAVAYKNDPNTRHFIQKSAALAFIPLAFIRVAWSGTKAGGPQQEIDDYIS